jgi:hypothetical protein
MQSAPSVVMRQRRRSPNSPVRSFLQRCCCRCSKQLPGLKVVEAAPALIRRLQDEDVEVREKAIKALAAIGPKSNATPALLAALGDKQSGSAWKR